MPTLTLPNATRGTLRAFWIVGSTGLGLVAGSAAALLRRDARLMALSVPVAAAVAVPGMRRPELVRPAYERWDRAGDRVGERCTDWLTRVAFVAMVATRRLGDTPEMPLRSTGASAWRPRQSQPASTYRLQDTVHTDFRGGDAFDHYARQPGHEWTAAIRPSLRLIAAVENPIRASRPAPSDVYTLY